MIMVLYNPRSSNLHYKDKDTLDFAGFPIADQASQRIAMMQNDIVNPNVTQNDIVNPSVMQNDLVNPSVMQNDAADQDIALGVTCDGEVKDIDHDQCQYGRPELFLIRPLETEDYGTLDDSLVALTEEQDHLLVDLHDRSNRRRLLLEEEQALL